MVICFHYEYWYIACILVRRNTTNFNQIKILYTFRNNPHTRYNKIENLVKVSRYYLQAEKCNNNISVYYTYVCMYIHIKNTVYLCIYIFYIKYCHKKTVPFKVNLHNLGGNIERTLGNLQKLY